MWIRGRFEQIERHAFRAVLLAIIGLLLSARAAHAQFLFNGQSVNYVFPPVSGPTLITQGPSGLLGITVPAGATSLTVEISTPAGQDLDLYLRYNTQFQIVNGQIAYDHRSATPNTGNERVVVNTTSNPPLRAGNYYIAIAALSFGQDIRFLLSGSFSTAPVCNFTATPATVAAPPAGGSGAITLTATDPSCAWTAASNQSWLTATPAGGSGSATINWTAAANLTTGSRAAALSVAGQTVSFTQAVDTALPRLTSAGVTNGASFSQGLTPGGIVSLFGTALTAGTGVISATALPLPPQIGGTSVRINGIAAPLFAVANVGGSQQINLQVPFEVTEAQQTASIVVTNGTRTSVPVTVPILAAHPGIFTVGGGAAAALHGANSALITAASPADRGEAVVLYVTGLGPVSPVPPSGGAAPGDPLSRTTATPVVTVGGVNAEVFFSGLAPGFVGLYQINFRVPESVAPGAAVSLQVRVGTTSSQSGVTLAVR